MAELEKLIEKDVMEANKDDDQIKAEMINEAKTRKIDTKLETRKNKAKYGKVDIRELHKSEMAIMTVINREKSRAAIVTTQKDNVVNELKDKLRE